ncbi:MAG: hypothetical protein AB1345_11870 [Chloroflexota bacterium]
MMSNPVLIDEEQLVNEIHATSEEYWPNLLQLIRLFRESVTLKPAVESFRQGWQEAITGQTHPVSKPWEGIDAGEVASSAS